MLKYENVEARITTSHEQMTRHRPQPSISDWFYNVRQGKNADNYDDGVTGSLELCLPEPRDDNCCLVRQIVKMSFPSGKQFCINNFVGLA